MADEQKKISKGMGIIAWLIALALLYSFFDGYLVSQNNPNQQVTSFRSASGTEVVLQRNRYGHYVTSGQINGHPVVFMLDTGATNVSIPEAVANRIGLQRGRSYGVNTANGSIRVFGTQINSLSIGEITLFDVSGHINPFMEGEEILLGMSALKRLSFTQQGNQLILKVNNAE